MTVNPLFARLPCWFQGTLCGLVAAILQWVFLPFIGSHTPFLFFFPALLMAAVSFGRCQASVILILGALNAVVMARLTGAQELFGPHTMVAMLLFVLVGGAVIQFCSRIHLTQQRVTLAERRLALAQENTGVGVFELDFQAGTAYVSPSMSKMLGQPVITGSMGLKQWLESLHREHWADTQKVMQARLRNGESSYEREQCIPLANGETIWVLNRIHLEATPTGELIRARGAAVDVTARRKADDVLQSVQLQVQQQLEDLTHLHAFSQTLVSSDSGMPVAMKGLLDVLIDLYATGHGVVSLIKPDGGGFEPVAYSGFDTGDVLRATGLIAAQEDVSEPDAYTSLLRSHAALAAMQALQSTHDIPLIGSSGAAIGAISIMFAQSRQQTERETRLCETCATTAAALVERDWARAAVKETENRFSIALESSSVSFSILTPLRDIHGEIMDFEWNYLNDAACQAIGLERHQLIGRRIKEVLPTAWDPPGHFDQYRQCIERNKSCQFELRTDAARCGIRWYNVVTSPLQGSLAVWFANITDRKLYEQSLEDADRRKDEFLTTLAHELRNPLAAIRQGVSIVGNSNASDLQKRRGHAVIERQVQQMSLILDDLLDVAKVGRGTLVLRKSKESLNEIIDTSIETALPHIEAKRHNFSIERTAESLIVDVDPLRMAQVVANLLINAAKYTDLGGTIRMSIALSDYALVISIRDSGIGLTREQLNHVFNMYSQVASALDKSEGGLGIGLALAQGIVSLHDGFITASSDGLGKGAEFSIQLPRSCVSIDTGVGSRRVI